MYSFLIAISCVIGGYVMILVRETNIIYRYTYRKKIKIV